MKKPAIVVQFLRIFKIATQKIVLQEQVVVFPKRDELLLLHLLGHHVIEGQRSECQIQSSDHDQQRQAEDEPSRVGQGAPESAQNRLGHGCHDRSSLPHWNRITSKDSYAKVTKGSLPKKPHG